VVVVAEGVVEVHGAAEAPDGKAAVLYERGGANVLAYFDIATLQKTRESQVRVPKLI
jgi:hypothetical protein